MVFFLFLFGYWLAGDHGICDLSDFQPFVNRYSPDPGLRAAEETDQPERQRYRMVDQPKNSEPGHPTAEVQRELIALLKTTERVHQIAATWQKQVFFTPDPTGGGERRAVLAGRLYFWDNVDSPPISADGKVVVELFNDAVPLGTPPVKLEQWEIDNDTLQRLLQKDIIGLGYTLGLPWGTYRPELTAVHFKVRFEPAGGETPIYCAGEPIGLCVKDGKEPKVDPIV